MINPQAHQGQAPAPAQGQAHQAQATQGHAAPGQGQDQSMAAMAEALNPQQMDQYKKGFQIGQYILYDKDRFSKLADIIPDDPVTTVAGTMVLVLQKIEEKIGPVDLTVLLMLGVMLLNDIAMALQETGDAQLSDEDIQGALQEAVGMWLRANGDRYSPEEIMGPDGAAQAAAQGGSPQGQGQGMAAAAPPAAAPPPGLLGGAGR